MILPSEYLPPQSPKTDPGVVTGSCKHSTGVKSVIVSGPSVVVIEMRKFLA